MVRRGMLFPPYGPEAKAEIGLSIDKVRTTAIALALHTIDAKSIAGAMAELGVYQGEVSRVLRRLSPSRTLYLFDTFTGFPDGRDKRFRDTSPDLVRRAVGGDASHLVIRQGIFPDSSRGLESETFAFVMLDADRYDATLAGLRFFVPRLVKGGYLFAHDFNNPESDYGVSRAFGEFFGSSQTFVELPDVCGSVVLRSI